ncbi:MAG: translation initiation factor IF-2 [Promethearchaeati archaeon SRVP18_Atabeyarchaeia-1]
MLIRQPIVAVLGHVNAGKTTLLDRIRGTAISLKEAGGLTQHIGASNLPSTTIEKICGDLLEKFKIKLAIPGLLIIDTPGHEIFMNLRRRGGAVADIAILVVDFMKGLEAQTYESVSILKSRKTPFIIAYNKVDRVEGWRPTENAPFGESISKQADFVKKLVDERIYELIGEMSKEGFSADRFDAITDFTKNVAIIPTSAKTGEGIPELLAILAGLTQSFMMGRLQVEQGPAKGTVLEVRDEPGLGTTIDVIIYNGILRKGDTIVVGGKDKALVTKVRGLVQPKPLVETGESRDKFTHVEEVSAAAGVKIIAPELVHAVSGAPLVVASTEQDIQRAVADITSEINRIKINTDTKGVILKVDTLGALEAIVKYLEDRKIPIRIADVSDVSKRDIMEAAAVKEDAPFSAVVLSFNVRVMPEAKEEADRLEIPVFKNDVVYKLVDEYEGWVKERKEEEKRKTVSSLVLPAKIKILPGYIFRRSHPVIVGVEVLAGTARAKTGLITEKGDDAGEIAQMQDEGKTVAQATKGRQVAVSIKGNILVGRQINEGDILYANIPEQDIRILRTKLEDELTSDDLQVLSEFIEIKRKKNPVFAL